MRSIDLELKVLYDNLENDWMIIVLQQWRIRFEKEEKNIRR